MVQIDLGVQEFVLPILIFECVLVIQVEMSRLQSFHLCETMSNSSDESWGNLGCIHYMPLR